MEDTHETPTALDNPKNRLREFVSYAAAHFNLRAATEIQISFDKNR